MQYPLQAVLKNKIQLRKFEDVIDCIEWVMNQVASHPASKEKPENLYNMESFYRQKLGETKWLSAKEKARIISGKVTFFEVGSCQADCLSFFWKG